MKHYFCFDLDHTVIDSSHRQLTKPDGSLDLDHWIENCTREKVLADSLLPLATTMQRAINTGKQVLICTARVIGEADLDFLMLKGLYAHNVTLLSRPEGDRSSDHLLKERLLKEFAKANKLHFANFAKRCFFYDDNQDVLQHLAGLGFNCLDSVRINKAIQSWKS